MYICHNYTSSSIKVHGLLQNVGMSQLRPSFEHQKWGINDKKTGGISRLRLVHSFYSGSIFGPTVQGEGMVIGQKTMFVRTAGCDYQCAWCDSAFTWNGTGKQDIRRLTAAEIADDLRRIGGDTFSHVTIDPSTSWQSLFNLFNLEGGQVEAGFIQKLIVYGQKKGLNTHTSPSTNDIQKIFIF